MLESYFNHDFYNKIKNINLPYNPARQGQGWNIGGPLKLQSSISKISPISKKTLYYFRTEVSFKIQDKPGVFIATKITLDIESILLIAALTSLVNSFMSSSSSALHACNSKQSWFRRTRWNKK